MYVTLSLSHSLDIQIYTYFERSYRQLFFILALTHTCGTISGISSTTRMAPLRVSVLHGTLHLVSSTPSSAKFSVSKLGPEKILSLAPSGRPSSSITSPMLYCSGCAESSGTVARIHCKLEEMRVKTAGSPEPQSSECARPSRTLPLTPLMRAARGRPKSPKHGPCGVASLGSVTTQISEMPTPPSVPWPWSSS